MPTTGKGVILQHHLHMEKAGSARVIHTREQSPGQGIPDPEQTGGFPLLLGTEKALPAPSHRQAGLML